MIMHSSALVLIDGQAKEDAAYKLQEDVEIKAKQLEASYVVEGLDDDQIKVVIEALEDADCADAVLCIAKVKSSLERFVKLYFEELAYKEIVGE